MSCVNQSTGVVENSLPALQQWHRGATMESVLVGLKNLMISPQNKRLAQPPEGSYY